MKKRKEEKEDQSYGQRQSSKGKLNLVRIYIYELNIFVNTLTKTVLIGAGRFVLGKAVPDQGGFNWGRPFLLGESGA